MDSESRSPGFGFSEALLLGLITAAAYITAYSFESSVCDHFSIPHTLIRISTEVLVASFLGVFGFVMSGFVLINVIVGVLVPSQRNPNSLWHAALIGHAAVAAFGVLVFQAIGFTWRGLAYFVGFVAVVDAIITATAGFVVLLVRWLGRRLPPADREAVLKEVAADPPLDVVLLLWRHVQRQYLIALICLIVIFIVAGLAGVRVARLQRSFSAIEPKGLVIVRGYGDFIICKPIAGEKGEKLGAATLVFTTEQLTDLPITVKRFAQPPEIEKL